MNDPEIEVAEGYYDVIGPDVVHYVNGKAHVLLHIAADVSATNVAALLVSHLNAQRGEIEELEAVIEDSRPPKSGDG